MKKKEKQKAKRKKQSRATTALVVRHEETALTRDDRQEIVGGLDSVLGKAGQTRTRKAQVTQALAHAAEILAPHFAVSAAFVDVGQRAQVENTEVLVEVLCSAGAWLAHSRGMSKEELVGKFGEWAQDQGYE